MARLVHGVAKKLSDGGAFIASILLLTLVVLILVEIVLRYFFNTSTMRADEYSGYLYLALVCFGFGYTFMRDGHIRITFLTAKVSSKTSTWIDIFAGIVTLGVLIFAFYRTLLLSLDSFHTEVVSEGVSATPLYIPQMVLPIGFLLFIVALIAYIVGRLGGHHDL
jgi:TRAP-type transport system small permease protein